MESTTENDRVLQRTTEGEAGPQPPHRPLLFSVVFCRLLSFSQNDIVIIVPPPPQLPNRGFTTELKIDPNW